jgi:tripartite-type tricarboxylate transporter receptor subunit TctC
MSARGIFARILVSGLSLAMAGAARAAPEDVAAFYKGRQVTVVVGTSPGGGYDLYGRLVARYLGKYIPGNPTVIVNNMPGAASIVSLQYVYNVAPKDGTVIGAVYPGAIMEPLLGDAARVRFDVNKLEYVGSANSELYVCAVRTDTGVQTFDDFLTKDFTVGASASGGSTRDFPNLLKQALGAKMRIISGYPGSNEISLAIDKKEVQGVCGIGWSSVSSSRPQWIDGAETKIIAQEGLSSSPQLDKLGVAMAISRARTEEQKQVMNLFYAPLKFGRPFVMAPGIPPERADAIRNAFMQAMKDPQLVADAEKMRIDIGAVDGKDVRKLVEQLYASSPSVVEKARAIISSGM